MDKNIMNKDILEDLFISMPSEQPCEKFTVNLMQVIEQKTVKAEKREDFWSLFCAIAVSAVLIAMAVVYFIRRDIKYPDFPELQIDTQINLLEYKSPAIIAGLILLLLLGDHWIRRYYNRKKRSVLQAGAEKYEEM